MSSFNWQDSVAGATVFAAVVYLARRAWNLLARKRMTGCGSGGCGSCSTNGASQTIVELKTRSESKRDL